MCRCFCDANKAEEGKLLKPWSQINNMAGLEALNTHPSGVDLFAHYYRSCTVWVLLLLLLLLLLCPLSDRRRRFPFVFPLLFLSIYEFDFSSFLSFWLECFQLYFRLALFFSPTVYAEWR